jgi:hypothetical protein
MATRRTNSEPAKPRRPPSPTPEGRENQLISLAVDLVEKQLVAGTASSQVITHYLKLGSTREQLEQKKLEQENEMLRVKAEAIAGAKRVEELYETALHAMRAYSGQDPIETYDDDEA